MLKKKGKKREKGNEKRKKKRGNFIVVIFHLTLWKVLTLSNLVQILNSLLSIFADSPTLQLISSSAYIRCNPQEKNIYFYSEIYKREKLFINVPTGLLSQTQLYKGQGVSEQCWSFGSQCWSLSFLIKRRKKCSFTTIFFEQVMNKKAIYFCISKTRMLITIQRNAQQRLHFLHM